MIDLLYLTWNRREFTEASLKALRENTDWSLVRHFHSWDDGSQTEDPPEFLQRFMVHLPNNVLVDFDWKEHTGSPVVAMNRYLAMDHRPAVSPIFCKLDNDVIVPPGWLNESLAVMEANPEVDLLGIEPGVGPDPAATRPIAVHHRRTQHLKRGICPCDFIGGIGLMRRRAFEGRGPLPAAGRFGFGHWQERNADIKKAWIAPGLPLFLLNRLPFEPWASLSRGYVAKGWQRDWPEPYTEEDKQMWEWWKP